MQLDRQHSLSKTGKDPRGRSRQTKIAATEAIGAFCTDICDSTNRIEKFQERALRHHKKYLEATARYFLRRNKTSEGLESTDGDLWVPGDSLWAVFYAAPKKTLAQAVNLSLWQAVSSFAYGLTVANASLSGEVEPLKTKSVFLVGPVMREIMLENIRIYNGTALNTCGRLEKSVEPNTIVAGFVYPKNQTKELPLETVAQLPEIYITGEGGLERYLRSCLEPKKRGCTIELDAVRRNGRHLLRFTGWPKRSKLQGLGGCHVLTTRIKLSPREDRGFSLVYDKKRSWDRSESEVLIADNARISDWDVHDLLRHEKDAFAFVKRIYKKGELMVRFSPDDGGTLVLQSYKTTHRPRVKRGSGFEPRETKMVDLKKHGACFLPTIGDSRSGRRNLLLQAYRKGDVNTICFSLVGADLANYEDYGDFLDSGCPAREISFRNVS